MKSCGLNLYSIASQAFEIAISCMWVGHILLIGTGSISIYIGFVGFLSNALYLQFSKMNRIPQQSEFRPIQLLIAIGEFELLPPFAFPFSLTLSCVGSHDLCQSLELVLTPFRTKHAINRDFHFPFCLVLDDPNATFHPT
jgi:hypothetical protein